MEDSSATHAALDRLIPLVERGSAVVLVDLDARIDPARVYVPGAAGARVLAARGGRLLPTFTESPNAPVMTSAAFRWDEPMLRVMGGAAGFLPAYDFKRFRYAIVHTALEGNAAVAVEAMKRDAKVLGAAGEFVLLESKLDVAPVLSPDAPLPNPHPPTLLQKMTAVAAKWRQQQAE